MRQYLLRIITSGIICALATIRFKKTDAVGRIIRLLCGIYMTISVIAPWKNVRLTTITDAFELGESEKKQIIDEGTQYAQETFRDVITQQCSTYIVEKANAIGVDIDAEVVLNRGEPPTPCAVTIKGAVSPYAKSRLEEIIMQDLGIPKEQQIWK